MDHSKEANNLTKLYQSKINIRSTAAAANPKKNVRNNIKPFESKICISPIKATIRNIEDSDVTLKENTLISYESYKQPPLLRRQIYTSIKENYGSKYSAVGKEMAKLTESKLLSEEDETVLLKYIKEPYPVAIKINYTKTFFVKNRD